MGQFAFRWGVWAAWLAAPVWAYAQQSPHSIYTCVDAQGQRITADRPIAACRDREQRVLSPSGFERTRLGPVLSEHEQAEQRKAQAQEERRLQQLQEVRRREATLLQRYPDRASHDAERQQQLLPFTALMALARTELQARQAQVQQLQAEVARQTAAGQPASVRLASDVRQAQAALQAQETFVQSVQTDSDKLQRRFDEELARLQVLWSRAAPAEVAGGAAEPAAATP